MRAQNINEHAVTPNKNNDNNKDVLAIGSAAAAIPRNAVKQF